MQTLDRKDAEPDASSQRLLSNATMRAVSDVQARDQLKPDGVDVDQKGQDAGPERRPDVPAFAEPQ